MAIINILHAVTLDIKRHENSQTIHSELNKLKQEFIRFENRWVKVNNDFIKVAGNINDLNITSNKIIKKFNEISDVEI